MQLGLDPVQVQKDQWQHNNERRRPDLAQLVDSTLVHVMTAKHLGDPQVARLREALAAMVAHHRQRQSRRMCTEAIAAVEQQLSAAEHALARCHWVHAPVFAGRPDAHARDLQPALLEVISGLRACSVFMASHEAAWREALAHYEVSEQQVADWLAAAGVPAAATAEAVNAFQLAVAQRRQAAQADTQALGRAAATASALVHFEAYRQRTPATEALEQRMCESVSSLAHSLQSLQQARGAREQAEQVVPPALRQLAPQGRVTSRWLQARAAE